MTRSLSQSEKDLWGRVAATITPLKNRNMNIEPVELRAPSLSSTEFNPVLDLHGMTVHAAHFAVIEHITTAALDRRFKYVIIITGLSGQIHDEFPKWLDRNPRVRSINPLRGGGAWEIWLKKDT